MPPYPPSSRVACFKCGGVGHFVETCPEPQRLCYNCRKPGHESNTCSEPRSTLAKQCYQCQVIGHVQAECPLNANIPMGMRGIRCYNCAQFGHKAMFCTKPPLHRPTYGMTHTCYKCGGPNHFARDCQAPAVKCYACGKPGHISRDCSAPNGGPLNNAGKSCYRCGELGHIARFCQNIVPSGEVPQDADIANAAPNVPVPIAPQAIPAPPIAPIV